MAALDFLNAGTQLAGQFGGMVLQNSYNKKAEKRQDKFQRGLADYQVQKQDEMNKNAQKIQLDTWDKTNYDAQRKQMEKAGLNVGLMYGQGGGGGATLGTAAGSAGQGSVQTHAPDAQGAAQGAGMALMNAAQIGLIKAQTENVNADTNNKVNGIPGQIEADTQVKTADARTKEFDLNIKRITQADTIDKIESEALIALQETQKRATELGTLNATQEDQIQIIKQTAVEQALRIEAQKLNMQATEAQIKKVAAEIERMQAQTSQGEEGLTIQQREALTKQLQQEFNTSTPAQIKQWVDIGTNVVNAMKKHKTTIDRRTYNDNSKTEFNE